MSKGVFNVLGKRTTLALSKAGRQPRSPGTVPMLTVLQRRRLLLSDPAENFAATKKMMMQKPDSVLTGPEQYVFNKAWKAPAV
jgi:hypothetical protein